MYRAIKEKFEGIHQTNLAEETGLAIETINRIINGKQTTTKPTALVIVKTINAKAKLEDYFEKGE